MSLGASLDKMRQIIISRVPRETPHYSDVVQSLCDDLSALITAVDDNAYSGGVHDTENDIITDKLSTTKEGRRILEEMVEDEPTNDTPPDDWGNDAASNKWWL